MSELREAKPTKVTFEISPQVEGGLYANAATVFHGDSEFLIDFGLVLPGKNAIRVQTRVITSPRHAKQLLLALKDNIDKYEARYGTISLPSRGGPMPVGPGTDTVN